MKKLFTEFRNFINKGNALSLAIGVILGASFTSIVTAINTKVISPLIGLLLGDADLSNSLITVLKSNVDAETGEVVITNAIYWGALIQSVIDFLLTALILFSIFKIASNFTNTLKKIQDKEVAILSFYSTIAEASKNITMRNDFTLRMLEALGFKWSKISFRYLKYLKKMV